MRTHHYELTVTWNGNLGEGTRNYRAYSRNHEITAEGKPRISASADPSFRGDPAHYNPEELFVASLSQCHMLWFLHLAAVSGVVVTSYTDVPQGTMQEADDGSGKFLDVVLRPVVSVTSAEMVDKAESLHTRAHEMCFIANSVNMPVRCEPTATVAG